MALHRGIQSAVFYYLSCAPCTEASYRRRRRKEAQLDRAEKRAYEEANPGLYRHPSPFATNPHWQAEIDLGPGRPIQANNKRKKDKSDSEPSPLASSEMTGSRLGSKEAVSPELAVSAEAGDVNGSRTTIRRFQREDEELWGALGLDVQRRSDRHLDASAGAEGGVARPPTARTTYTNRSATSYRSWQNPSLNDLHPATVTKLDSVEDVAWMLQPPPPAKVMLGKQRASRSRSDSGGSGLGSQKAEERLARQVSARLMEERIKKDAMLGAPAVSRGNSVRTSNTSASSKPRRRLNPVINVDYSSSSEDEPSRRTSRAKRKPRIAHISSDLIGSDQTVLHHSRSVEDKAKLTAAIAPRLSTINSGTVSPTSISPRTSLAKSGKRSRNNTIATSKPAPTSQPASRPTTRDRDRSSSTRGRARKPKPINTTIPARDPSLTVLQELAPRSSLLNIRASSRSQSNAPQRRLQKSPSFLEAVGKPLPATPGTEADPIYLYRSEDEELDHRPDSKGWDIARVEAKDSKPTTTAPKDSAFSFDNHKRRSSSASDVEAEYRSRRGSGASEGGGGGFRDSWMGLPTPGAGQVTDMQSWYEWATKKVSRDVSHRWSMDI